MNRFLKVAAWIFVSVGALLALLALAVKILLPPEKARAFVEKEMASRLHREVRLGGISVGLFSGLRVKDFSLSEKPTFAEGTFLSSERLELRLALAPLLARKFVIRDVRLVKPYVRIERTAEGSFNFADLNPTPATPAPAPQSPTPAAIVNGIEIADGRVEYVDRADPSRSAVVESLNATISGVSLGGRVEMEGEMKVRYSGSVTATALAAEIDLLRQTAEIRRLDTNTGETKLFTTGTIETLFSDPLFSIRTKIQPLDLALLKVDGLSGEARGTASVRGRPSDFTFDAALDLSNAVLVSTSTFSKPKGHPMTFAVNGRLEKMSTLTLDPLSLGVGTMRLTADGRIDAVMASTRTFALALHADSIPVDEILPRLPPGTLPSDLTLTGRGAMEAKLSGTASDGTLSVDITGDALDVRVTDKFQKPAGVAFAFQGAGRYAVPTAINFAEARVTISDLKLTGPLSFQSGKTSTWSTSLKSSSFPLALVAKLSPQVRDFSPTGTATVEVTARSNGAGDPDIRGSYTLKDGSARHQGTEFSGMTASGSFAPARQKGTLRAARVRHDHFDGKNIDLAWDLTGVTAELDKLSGSATLRTGSGEFRDTQKLLDGSRAARAVLLPLGVVQKLDRATGGALQIPSTERVPFTSITGDYTFKNGVMTAAPFRLDAEPFDALLNGSVGLSPNGLVNAKAKMTLPKGALRGSLGQFLADPDGSFSIDMSIGGTASKPEVRINTRKIENRIGDALGDALKDFLKLP